MAGGLVTAVDLSRLLRAPTVAVARAVDHQWLRTAEAHGVLPLLAHALSASPVCDALPHESRVRLRQVEREALVLDAMARHEATRITSSLSDHGIDTVVFKGAALAATHYDRSWHRPHGDVDLLIRGVDREAALAAVVALGYRRAPRPAGTFVTHQTRLLAPTVDFACDLHWRLADPEAFADTLTFDDLWAGAVAGETSRVRHPHPVDALLIACLHRAAHHHDSDRLLLVYDIHRLAQRFTTSDWDQFVRHVVAKRLRAVCRRGLELARVWLGTDVPAGVTQQLTGGDAEPTAAYVCRPLRRVDVLRSDLQHLAGWRNRMTLMREHLFPPRAYMEARYGRGPLALLPVRYLHRIVRGTAGWFRPLGSAPSYRGLH